MSIPIVDDTSIAAKLLELHIKSLGSETVTATSGEAALAALEAPPEIEAVITDTTTPGMDRSRRRRSAARPAEPARSAHGLRRPVRSRAGKPRLPFGASP